MHSDKGSSKTPLALIILDGWGYREESRDNAIFHANTPTWDRLWAEMPRTLIATSGLDVGLPEGQMGNSEVGHMSLGAGRIVYQNITRIDKAISEGSFFDNPAYSKAIDSATNNGKAVHIMGLLSPGGVHSHENQIFAMIEMAVQRGANDIFVHAFLDGRDTPPRSAKASLQALQDKLQASGCGHIASIVGRYYAMDRDNRWDRVEKAYRLLTEGQGEHQANDAVAALEAAYARDENDEFVAPTSIPLAGANTSINDGDAVIFMNFRADRARELTRCFVDPDFDGFTRQLTPKLADFVMTTEYAADLPAACAFPPESITNALGEYLAQQGKTQLRIAETEKYAHVTFFFSGGREESYQGEDRILIPSPDVATYDLKPEMSSVEVTDKLVAAITGGKYDVIVCNYANGDMVGHTGIFSAAIKAAEAVDQSIKRVTDAILAVGGDCLITADHGNCEQMLDYESNQPHTQHTTGPVPLVYVGKRKLAFTSSCGRLADIAPTMLSLLGLKQPAEMTGQSLIQLQSDS
jgi:2,3-bisphosphoglycerate-independent phosphoglycerate mutase